MSGPTLLVVAKAPVPGLAKTRIGATVGDDAAADLAAASLLDTLDTVRAVGWPVVVALTGDLDRAARQPEISEALDGVRVIRQRGSSLGVRLANAHLDADAGRGTVQVGMDTPQLTVADYVTAGRLVSAGSRVLGPATDGGWWLLGLPDGAAAHLLRRVPMSRDDTADRTRAALAPVVDLRFVNDMDDWDDAVAIAQQSPSSRLAAAVECVAALR